MNKSCLEKDEAEKTDYAEYLKRYFSPCILNMLEGSKFA